MSKGKKLRRRRSPTVQVVTPETVKPKPAVVHVMAWETPEPRPVIVHVERAKE